VIREARQLEPAELDALVELLVAVVDDGASIGWLPPLDRAAARAYWQQVLGPATVLLLAEQDGQIVGSAQLHLEQRANGRHRAEVAKLMVHPLARQRGLGRQLMLALEAVARREQRSLLVLDTRAGDPSNRLYQSLGYVEVGCIPRYARSAGGQLEATVFYFKELGGL
jgi:ribosomal protein S18 acetylase RimI-like enzyme